MRPAQVSNQDLLAAVQAVMRAKPSFEAAESAYLARGDEANRQRRDAAKAALDSARDARAREMRRYR